MVFSHVRSSMRTGSFAGALLMFVTLVAFALPAHAATTVPILWEAGGQSSGTDSAGEGTWITSDAAGNVTVLGSGSTAGPGTVTSYSPSGQLRWRQTITGPNGHFAANAIETAPDGDVVAITTNMPNSSSTVPLGARIARYSSTGTLEWQVDHPGSFVSYTRLVLDAQGNAYVVFSFNGTSVRKYSPTGALLWENAGNLGAVASSIALSPDGAHVYATSTTASNWIVIARNASTGAQEWVVNSSIGIAARDVASDGTRVYVAGLGNQGTSQFATVVAFDPATGAQLWRTDRRPADASGAAALWMDIGPDGNLAVAGRATRGFLDWFTLSLTPTGAVRWEAVRDGGLFTDEVPASVVAMADGSVVVTGPGGPALPGNFIGGVTAGYSGDGTLVWEGFSDFATRWATGLVNGDVCTTGGYDAYVSCFRPSGGGAVNLPPAAVVSASATSGVVPLTVDFDGSGSSDSDGSVASHAWSFGDGGQATGSSVSHVYTTAGTHTATLTVTDDDGATASSSVMIVVSGVSASGVAHLSSTTGGTVGGVTFADEDVVSVDLATGVWSMLFDGSDVGLSSADVDGFERLADGSMLLSFESNVRIGRARFDDSDVVRFVPTSTGSTTSGSFSMYVSGASLGLTTNDEDVDGIGVTAGGSLVLSTTGRLSAGGVTAEDEDLVLVTGTALSLYADGSAMGLEASTEDVWGVSIGSGGELRLSAQGGFTLPDGLTGGAGAVLSCGAGTAPIAVCASPALLGAASLAPFGGEVIDAVAVSG